MEGLGFLPALCVPHHDSTQSNGLARLLDAEAMLLRYPDQPLIGIDEAAALVVADGKVRVVSADGQAGCVLKRVVKKSSDPSIETVPFSNKEPGSLMELLSL